MVTVHPSTSRENLNENQFDYQLQKQKDEYEAIIQRHLKFIDQVKFFFSSEIILMSLLFFS